MARMQTETSEVETGPFVVATALIGVGGLLAFVGVFVGLLHALSQVSRLVRQMETPPNEIARSKMNQLMAAANAGANAWKDYAVADGGS